MIPFLERLDTATNVLVVGCGGGFDVYAGVPLAQHLMARGKHVVFASLSFTNLWLCGGERVGETMWRVDQQATDIPYFPEKWLAEWLSRRDQLVPIYAFAKSGVRPLATAYRSIMDRHDIDTVVLVEGGTDSILFGNEPGLGTVIEDAVSIVAADQAAGERVLLAAIGFGVDHYHGVSHHAYLENVAQLIRDGGFLGSRCRRATWRPTPSLTLWTTPTSASRSTKASCAIRSRVHCGASSATIMPPTARAAMNCSSIR